MDLWAPGDLKHFAVAAFDDVCSIAERMDAQLLAPQQATRNLVALKQKPNGGDRPLATGDTL